MMTHATGRFLFRFSVALLMLAMLALPGVSNAKPKMVSGDKAKWSETPGYIVGEARVDNPDLALPAAQADAMISALQELGTYKNLDLFRDYYVATFQDKEAPAALGPVAREYLELVKANYTLANSTVQGWKDGKKTWSVGIAAYTANDTSNAWQKEFAEKYIAEGEAALKAAATATESGAILDGLEKSARAYDIFNGLIGAFGESHPEFPQITDMFEDAEFELSMKLEKLSVWPVVKRKYIDKASLPKTLTVTTTYAAADGDVPLPGLTFSISADDGVVLADMMDKVTTGDDGKGTFTLAELNTSGPAGVTLTLELGGTGSLGGMAPTSKFEFIDAASGKTFKIDDAPMVKVEGGSFEFGASADDPLRQDDEVPVVQVKVNSFYIDAHEVTNAQYKAFLEDTGYRGESKYAYLDEFSADDKPVIGISWKDAKAYALWAGKRLPNEAEWEYAASGAGQTIYPWGNEFEATACVNENNGSGTAAVGTVGSANSFGLYDAAGNVWEWVNDAYDWDLLKKQQADSLYSGTDVPADLRSVRGGSYKSGPADLRTSNRLGMNPEARTDDIGFRCARDAND